MSNSSQWIVKGKQAGIDLDFMFQDKTTMHEKLDELGLPHPDYHHFSMDRIDDAMTQLNGGKTYFSRLVPRDKNTPRLFQSSMRTPEDLKLFLGSEDLTLYKELHLVEKGTVQYTGGIIATEQRGEPGPAIIELAEGDGPELFHGRSIPIQGRIGLTRILRFPHQQPTSQQRSIISRALHLIGGVKFPFPGYFEFEVWQERAHQPLFRNYQEPISPYAQLPVEAQEWI